MFYFISVSFVNPTEQNQIRKRGFVRFETAAAAKPKHITWVTGIVNCNPFGIWTPTPSSFLSYFSLYTYTIRIYVSVFFSRIPNFFMPWNLLPIFRLFVFFLFFTESISTALFADLLVQKDIALGKTWAVSPLPSSDTVNHLNVMCCQNIIGRIKKFVMGSFSKHRATLIPMPLLLFGIVISSTCNPLSMMNGHQRDCISAKMATNPMIQVLLIRQTRRT